MDRLIRSYLEEAVTNGESWDSDEDPNDVITAQDLLGYFDALVKRDAEARADTERLDQLEECWTFLKWGGRIVLEGFEYKTGMSLREALDEDREEPE